MSQEREGWEAPVRGPLIAAGAVLTVLVVGIAVAGHAYRAELRPSTRPPTTTFPAPRLETTQTPPRERRPDFRQPAPDRIGQAMRDTAAQGDAVWGSARP